MFSFIDDSHSAPRYFTNDLVLAKLFRSIFGFGFNGTIGQFIFATLLQHGQCRQYFADLVC